MTDKTFVYDLWLARDASAWIERDGKEIIAIERGGHLHRFAPVWGHPGRPVVSGDDAVWTEYREGVGCAAFADSGSESARLIKPLIGANVGDLALSAGHLVAECAGTLRLLTRARNGWAAQGTIWDESPAYHPCLVSDLASWDTYIGGRYRVVVMPLGGEPAVLPCPDDH